MQNDVQFGLFELDFYVLVSFHKFMITAYRHLYAQFPYALDTVVHVF